MRRPSGAYAPAAARGIGSASAIPPALSSVEGPALSSVEGPRLGTVGFESPSSGTVHSRKYGLAPGVGTALRVDANITRRPSGLQPRAASMPGCQVRRTGSPPVVDIT